MSLRKLWVHSTSWMQNLSLFSLCGSVLLYFVNFFGLLDQLVVGRRSIRRYFLDFNPPVTRVWRGPEQLSELVPPVFSHLFTSTRFLSCPKFTQRKSGPEIWVPAVVGEAQLSQDLGWGRSKSRNPRGSFFVLSSHTSPQGLLIVSPFLGVFLTWSLWGWS